MSTAPEPANLDSASENCAARGPWPWVVLAVWALWLAVMIGLSYSEIGRTRIPHDAPNVIRN